MAELIIGRHTRSNAVAALNSHIQRQEEPDTLRMGIGLVGIADGEPDTQLLRHRQRLDDGILSRPSCQAVRPGQAFSEWLTTDTEAPKCDSSS